MILTVTPNIALDITYRVDQLTPGSSHRVRRVEERAGGKGVNVAGVLRALGHDTVVLGFVGGATAGAVTSDLARGGLVHELIAVDGPTSKRGSPRGFRGRRRWSSREACHPAATTPPAPGSYAWRPRIGSRSWSTPSVRPSSRPPRPGPTS
jgi:hypothetical protein